MMTVLIRSAIAGVLLLGGVGSGMAQNVVPAPGPPGAAGCTVTYETAGGNMKTVHLDDGQKTTTGKLCKDGKLIPPPSK